jgi:hypothetical protein
MANIRTTKVGEEVYCSVIDVLELLKASKDNKQVIKDIEALLTPKIDDKDLSDFNKKLKQGLNWNPKSD